jgi:hypothetical protein
MSPVLQDNSKWINGMDEQIMSWATSRPEVSKDEDNYMVVFKSVFNFKSLWFCVLMCLLETGTHLVLRTFLFEQVGDSNFLVILVFLGLAPGR